MQICDDEAAHDDEIQCLKNRRFGYRCIQSGRFEQNLCRAKPLGRDTFPRRARVGLDQTRATACGNTTSISVPERPPVLIWNLARLASTRALVSDRLTPELSARSDGA